MTSGDEATRVSALTDAAAAVDGFPALNEATLLRLRHPRPGSAPIEVLVEQHDVLVAYGRLDRDVPGVATAALVVHPEHRRRGHGTAVADRLLAAAEGPVEIWAPGDPPAAAALAARAGLTPVRTLLIMSRPLPAADPDLDPAPPAGVTVRPFRVGADEPAWLALNARAFALHPEQGAVTADDLAERMAQPWFDPAGFLVAERDARLVGFHWTKVHEALASPTGLRGEVYVLGVDPDAGRGIGRLLLGAGLAHLTGRGCTEVILYVEADNPRAVRLYTGSGFGVLSRDVLYRGPRG